MENLNLSILKDLTDLELFNLLSKCREELKRRGIIKSNLIGDIGEHYALQAYNSTKGLPKLQKALTNTRNVDANSSKGERYTIKTLTTKTTGPFWGMSPPDSPVFDKQLFEYVIIVVLDNDYKCVAIYELSWNKFLKHRKWIKRQNAYNLNLTRSLKADCRLIYSSDKEPLSFEEM